MLNGTTGLDEGATGTVPFPPPLIPPPPPPLLLLLPLLPLLLLLLLFPPVTVPLNCVRFLEVPFWGNPAVLPVRFKVGHKLVFNATPAVAQSWAAAGTSSVQHIHISQVDEKEEKVSKQ